MIYRVLITVCYGGLIDERKKVIKLLILNQSIIKRQTIDLINKYR